MVVTGRSEKARTASISARAKSAVCAVTKRFQSSVSPWTQVSPIGEGGSISEKAFARWLQKRVHHAALSRSTVPYFFSRKSQNAARQSGQRRLP